jgi:hypothetical protein
MKPITFGSCALFVTVGLVLAELAIQRPAQSATRNAALQPVSTAVLSARQPAGGGSAQPKVSPQDPATITVAVHPMSAPVTSLVTQQFTATVTGTTNEAVKWSVDGISGGNSTVGVISTTGLYTPPATFVVGTHTITAISAANHAASGSATAYLVAYAGIYTNKNDNSRTGQDLQETVLTPTNVNVSSFGKLFSYPVDGGVQGQPLYVANVNIPTPLNGTAGYHNVVYFGTANDSVYAYDADGKVPAGPLWKASFIDPPTVVPVPGACLMISQPLDGITATGVIDPTTNTIYVEVRTLEGQTTPCSGSYVHRLHALDITTGAEKFGGPVVIQASVPGTGSGSVGGELAFDPLHENSRPGMLLSQSAQDVNSVVYFATAGNQDWQPYHGWVLGYDSQTLAQKYVFCTTPNGIEGGIWQMGGGLAADANGNIFVSTGNGTADASTDFGVSVLELTPNNGNLTLAGYYTPSNYATLSQQDWDVTSGGVLLLPTQPGTYPNLLVAGGKEGTIYVVNRDNLGGYQQGANNIVQYIVGAIRASILGQKTPYGIYNTPSYFNGNVYIFGEEDYPKMFTLSNGLLPTKATSTGPTMLHSPDPIISANGTVNGIVWMLEWTPNPTLYAYNPSDLTQEYYDTNQDKARDQISTTPIIRVNPTVANGRVYVPAKGSVLVYGLLQ